MPADPADTRPEPSRSLWQRRGSAILLGVTLVALTAQGAYAVFSVPIVLTHDGPQHLHSALLEARYDSNPAAQKALEHQAPLTANGFRALFRPLRWIFGWRTAYRLTLLIVALLFVASLAVLVVAVEPRRRWVAVAGFGIAFNWPLYMGFFNYCLGTTLALCLVAATLRADLGRRVHLLLIGLGLLVLAWVHLFGAVAAGGLILLVAALPSDGQGRWRRMGRVVLAGAPAALYALLVTLVQGSQSYRVGTTWAPNGLWHVGGLFVAGPGWRRAVEVLLAAIGLASGAFLYRSRRAPARGLPLLVGCVAFAALGATTPFHLSSWQFFSPRFLPFAVLLALALLPLERLPRPWHRATAAVVLVAISALSVGWAARFHEHQVTDGAPVVRALDAPLKRHGMRTSLVLGGCRPGPMRPMEQAVPYYTPLHHLGALMAAAQGGFALQLFSRSHALHAFTFKGTLGTSRPAPDKAFFLRQRRERLAPLLRRCARDRETTARPACAPAHRFERFKEAVLSYYASAAVEADDISLWSRYDHDWFRQRGFVADREDGPLFIGRFVGCPLTVNILGPPPGRTLTVAYGWYPLDVAKRIRKVTVPAAPRSLLAVPLERPPCGPIWIQVRNRDGNGPLSAGDWICARADGRGRIALRNAPALREYNCFFSPLVQHR